MAICLMFPMPHGCSPLIPSAAMPRQGLMGMDVERENQMQAEAGPSVAGGGTPVERPRTSENRQVDFYCVSGDLSAKV